MSGWNLPPGVTDAMIDAQFGGRDCHCAENQREATRALEAAGVPYEEIEDQIETREGNLEFECEDCRHERKCQEAADDAAEYDPADED